MSSSACIRPPCRHSALYFVWQRTLLLLLCGASLFVTASPLRAEVGGVDFREDGAELPEFDIMATMGEDTDNDLIQIVRQFGPRLVVSGSLLAWGLLAPELPGSAVTELPPGEPVARNEVLSRAGTVAALLTMGTATAGRVISEWPNATSAVSVSSAVIATAYAARSYLKGLFLRTRPAAVLDGTADDPDDHRSFPSGHALLAWSCVGDALIGTVRGTAGPWLLPAVTIEAVVVSCLRVAAGEHYPGDVIAGAAVGLVVGAIVSTILLPL